MNKKKLNIGMVGYGFMGRTHSNAFRSVSNFFNLPYQPVLKTICARNPERLEAFKETWGYESTATDWRSLIERDDIDLIDIASPNDTHAEIAIAAAKAAAGSLPLRRVVIKDTRTRWGSCTADQTLMFCWRLVMAPPYVQDYVVAHEVAHLRHMNHGHGFWTLVAQLTPNRSLAMHWLDAHGPGLMRIGPPGPALEAGSATAS